MQVSTPEELLQLELQKLYSMENQLLEAMPRLITISHSEGLKKSLEEHLTETENQAKRLETIGADMDIEMTGAIDVSLATILKDGQTTLQEITDDSLKDTAIMGGAEKVEHYEMAAYESAITLAKQLGQDDVADTLQKSYDEEKNLEHTISSLEMDDVIGAKMKQAMHNVM